jgi:RHS repeat-associated protein
MVSHVLCVGGREVDSAKLCLWIEDVGLRHDGCRDWHPGLKGETWGTRVVGSTTDMGHPPFAQIGLATVGGTPAISMTRQYDSHERMTLENDGSLYQYTVPTSGYFANSNLYQATDQVNGAWTYGYDTLNRLTSAATTGAPYGTQTGCWTYDAFGNRTKEGFSTVTSTPCAVGANDNSQLTTATYSTSNNNHVVGFTYDAAGDVTIDSRNSYVYDAEGRLCGVATDVGGWSYYQYLYDAEGRRVGKGAISSLSNLCGTPTGANGFSLTNQYLLDLGGSQVTELSGTNGTVPRHTNVFAAGRLLGTYDFVSGGLHFVLTDQLGTKRVQVSGTGAAEMTCVSLPFGNNIGNTLTAQCTPVGANIDETEHHFTGKERDTESGNDYFDARYFASNSGRFFSPDPSGLRYASEANPQSLNLYGYARNNPLRYIDPDGLETAVYQWGNCIIRTWDWSVNESDGSTTVGNSTETEGDCQPDTVNAVDNAVLQGQASPKYDSYYQNRNYQEQHYKNASACADDIVNHWSVAGLLPGAPGLRKDAIGGAINGLLGNSFSGIRDLYHQVAGESDNSPANLYASQAMTGPGQGLLPSAVMENAPAGAKGPVGVLVDSFLSPGAAGVVASFLDGKIAFDALTWGAAYSYCLAVGY